MPIPPKPSMTPPPAQTPDKYGSDPVQFDAAMQAWLDWMFAHWRPDQASAIDFVGALQDDVATRQSDVESKSAAAAASASASASSANAASASKDAAAASATAAANSASAAAASAASAATSATNSTNSANVAASAVLSQLTSIKTQTETARDQALAGLGAADNSQVLSELVGAVQFAVSQAGALSKDLDDARNYRTMTGVVNLTQNASTDVIRTYPTAAVAFARPNPLGGPAATIACSYPDAGYQVDFEVLSASPNIEFAGQIRAQSKASNGFVVAMTGSATAASIRWTATYPNVK